MTYKTKHQLYILIGKKRKNLIAILISTLFNFWVLFLWFLNPQFWSLKLNPTFVSQI